MRACSPLALLIVCACTDGADRPNTTSADASAAKTEPAKIPTAAKREWPADTPEAMSCTAHQDCAVVVTAPGDDPCCDFTVTIGPRNRKYLEFVGEYRKQHCGGVECPPLALPGAMAAECANVPRCVANRCDTACNDPTAPKGAP